jgi:hypothetical protein
MRQFLTLVCLLGLALPAGISIAGCTRNPQGNYCNGLGYGLKDDQIASLTLQPQQAGISLAYGQTTFILSPQAFSCKGNSVPTTTGTVSFGTSNNQLVDISPNASLCAGTWNRNTGGGIADYTYCTAPNPLPSTNGLPYSIAYVTASAESVTSNPIPVYVHAPVTAISLVTTCLPSSGNCSSTTPLTSVPTQCFSQNQQAELDALGYYDNNGTQTLLCQPAATASVTAFSVSSDVVTVTTAANNFIPGENVTFSGLSKATFLNTGRYTVLPAGLSSTQFEVAATVPDQTGSDSGSATTTTSNPSCGSSIGTLNYASSNSTVASIAPETLANPFSTITALQPGTTTITASIAQSTGSAGYFSTCPPKSIRISLANGATSGVVTQGVTQNLTTTVIDTNNNPLTGLSLTYQSTNPIEITAGGGGAITASFPGVASIYAVCEPAACNPAPINEFGLNGTGLSLASNPVSITVPGSTSNYAWFAAPGESQYFSSLQLLTGSPGATVRLPYVPNSMLMDQLGVNLYFGSSRELMIYSTNTNGITKQDTSVPGVVLAASPVANQLLINDQVRGVLYLYNINTGTSSTYGGMGAAAAFTPDARTLYIVDNAELNSPASCSTPLITGHADTLYVYSANLGWSTYPLPPNPLPADALPTCTTQPDSPNLATAQALAITVPALGAYLAGNPTVAHTWCPGGLPPSDTTVGTVGNNASILFYPQSDSVNLLTNVLGATSDGQHMLGASLSGSSITLDDIALSIPPNSTYPSALCPEDTSATPQTMTPLATNPTINGTVALGTASGATTLNATQVNQVVTGTAPSTSSVTTAAPIAFITYNGATAGNQLPYYLPQANGNPVQQPGYVTFKYNNNTSTTAPPASEATAPLAGAFSPDNSIFFVSTAGDDWIHFISIPPNVSPSNPPVDSQQYSPNLPACTPVSEGGDDPGCLYPTILPAPTPSTFVPATVIVVKPRSVT